MDELTPEILIQELAKWTKDNGEGRNSSDLRFGQYIHNTYEPYGYAEGEDGYYKEKASEAYEILSKIVEL